MKTSTLTGSLLNCWVSRCLNPMEKIVPWGDDFAHEHGRAAPPFSENWAYGGQLVDRFRMQLDCDLRLSDQNEHFRAYIDESVYENGDPNGSGPNGSGPDYLIAIARAVVHKHFGDDVAEVGPDTLVPAHVP